MLPIPKSRRDLGAGKHIALSILGARDCYYLSFESGSIKFINLKRRYPATAKGTQGSSRLGLCAGKAYPPIRTPKPAHPVIVVP